MPTFEQTVRMAAGEPMGDAEHETESYGAKAAWPELVGANAQEAADTIHLDRPDVNIFFAMEGAEEPGQGQVDSRVLIWIEAGATSPADGVVAEPAPRVSGPATATA